MQLAIRLFLLMLTSVVLTAKTVWEEADAHEDSFLLLLSMVLVADSAEQGFGILCVQKHEGLRAAVEVVHFISRTYEGAQHESS